MSDSRELSYARGSSACWGVPGLAPQQDGSINIVPDETNLACTCSDSTCDYYAKLLMPLYLDSKWDIFHKHEELLGQVEFLGHGKKDANGTVQWTYKCEVIDAEATHKISCDEATSPDPSTYFKAYQVSLSDPSEKSAKPGIHFKGTSDACSLYAIKGDVCGQSDVDCKYTKYAKAAEKALKDGTCASHGYTVKGKSTSKTYPVVGKITITEYTKPLLAASEEKIMKVNIQNSMSDSRDLYYARGSSACWGIPGLAPQQDGSLNIVPDETNTACTCSDSTCDYYAKLLMPLYLDSKLDIFHKHEELLGQVEFLGHGKKDSSGAVQWTYKCEVIDAEATHNISCDEVTSPDPSTYFKAYQVSLSDPSEKSAKPRIHFKGATDTCSLYSMSGDVCGQSDIDCKYTSYAKAAEKSLQDGTCASQGYTVKGTSTTKSYPIIGDITITQYTKPSEAAIVV